MASRILIADDTEFVLAYLELVFEKSGFEVIPARGGDQAVQLAKKASPDLLLVDIMMPDVDGFEVCRRLRSDPDTSHLPILLYSTVVGEEVRARARAAGADEFLGKSMHHADLVERVRDWLASRSLPGGAGEPSLVEVALDMLNLLEADLVWLLAETVADEFRTLAIASERGEQEALRIASVVGSGPFSSAPSTVLGELFGGGRVRVNWSLHEVGLLEGGGEIVEAMKTAGASALMAAPLKDDLGRRGAMLASAAPTLSRSNHQNQRLSASLRYFSLALHRWLDGR